MADFAQTLAQMIAAARPPQAPSPGHVTVAGGGGPTSTTMAKGSVDLGAIQRFFSQSVEEKKKSVDQAFALFTEMGASQDPNMPKVRDAVFSNPVVQKRMEEAYNAGDARVTIKEVPQPGVMPSGSKTWTPTGREEGELQQTEDYAPAVKKMYTFAEIPATVESQKAAIMKGMGQPEKIGEALPGAETQKILAGMYGEAYRNKLLGSLVAQGRAGATGVENEDLKEANKAWDSLYQQYAKEVDALQPDDEAGNYRSNRKLAGGLTRYLARVAKATGSPDSLESVGAMWSWIMNVDREMNRETVTKDAAGSKTQRTFRNNYIDMLAGVLKVAKPTSIEPYAALMDWVIDARGGDEAIKFMKEQFKASNAQIETIFSLTKNSAEQLGEPQVAGEQKAPWYKSLGLDKIFNKAMVEPTAESRYMPPGRRSTETLKILEGITEEAIRKRALEESKKRKGGVK